VVLITKKNRRNCLLSVKGGFTACCASRYVCSEVGVPTSTYVVGYCSLAVSFMWVHKRDGPVWTVYGHH